MNATPHDLSLSVSKASSPGTSSLTYFWEWEPVDFSLDYQANVPSTADFDIVICLLWSRLGSRLGQQHKLPPDYTRAASSGTEYELLQALHGKRQHPAKLPDLLLWVNKAPPPPATSPPLSRKEEDERIAQRRALQDFLARLTLDASTGTFTAAMNRYEIAGEDIDSYQYLDQFEELMEHKLRKLIRKHVGQPSVKPKPEWKGSPFRDLNVFEFHHASIFFGRSRAIGEVVRLLQNTLAKPEPCHFALVLGASGSGKSSLARAGVLPLLTRPGVMEGIGLWRCAIMCPSDDNADLFQALAAALLRTRSNEPSGCPAALPELGDPESENAQQTLADELRDYPQTAALRVKDKLIEAARAHEAHQRHVLEEQATNFKMEGRQDDAAVKQQTLQRLTTPVARLALLLDQMEELFTLNYAPEALRTFLHAIDVLARSGRVFVLGTLRSDLYPLYQEHETLVALANDGARFDLLPPSADEISQIIRRPATLACIEFEEDAATHHSLADTLRDEAIADAEALPLLEHVLNRLYEAQVPRADGRLSFADHRDLGGVGGALGKHAEDAFTRHVPTATDATFDAVFRCLITLGEGEQDVPNRRAFAYDDLIKVDPAARALVDTFIHERLFIGDQSAQSRPIVRLSHEALLTRWPRLSQWLQTAQVRDFMSMRRRLESNLRQWQEQGRNPDYLLSPGLPLEEAKQMLQDHEVALKPEEKEFIVASAKHEEAGEQRAKSRRRVAFAVLTALSVSLAWALVSTRKALRNERELANFERKIFPFSLVVGYVENFLSPLITSLEKEPSEPIVIIVMPVSFKELTHNQRVENYTNRIGQAGYQIELKKVKTTLPRGAETGIIVPTPPYYKKRKMEVYIDFASTVAAFRHVIDYKIGNAAYARSSEDVMVGEYATEFEESVKRELQKRRQEGRIVFVRSPTAALQILAGANK